MQTLAPADASVTRDLSEPRYFEFVSMAFIAVYLTSQVSSTKLIAIGPFQFPGAIIIFPIAYIFGDILTEVYGYARTRRVIWTGFAAAAFLAIVLWTVQYLPPAPNWPNQLAYEKILGFVPRVVGGSLLAYWAGEFTNSYVMAKMKVLTKGRMLWTRTIGSTIAGQAVDTAVFVTVAFAAIVPPPILLRIGGSVYLFKVIYEVLATPFTYWLVNLLKRAEGVDVFDYHTNFSPFRLR